MVVGHRDRCLVHLSHVRDVPGAPCTFGSGIHELLGCVYLWPPSQQTTSANVNPSLGPVVSRDVQV